MAETKVGFPREWAVDRHASVSAQILMAVQYATYYHRDQRRKNPAALPYVTHPLEALGILQKASVEYHPVYSVQLAQAIILHDVLEDTKATTAEVGELFGKYVLDLIQACSDDKSLPKVTRKKLELEHTRDAIPAVKLIKLADKRSNVKDLFTSPPTNWTDAERRGYGYWAYAICNAAAGILPELDAEVREFFARHGIAPTGEQLEAELAKYYAEIERVEAAKV